MKNSSIRIFALVVVAAIMGACSGTGDKAAETDSNQYMGGAIKGNGNVITREIPIKDYKILVVDRNVDVHYKQSDAKPYLKITADANIIDAINPRVHKGRLILSRQWPCIHEHQFPTIVPTKCVVETNSRQLIAVGSNIWSWGSLCYRLQHSDTVNFHEEYFFQDLNNGTDTSAAYGAIVDVKKIQDAKHRSHVTVNIVHDRPQWDKSILQRQSHSYHVYREGDSLFEGIFYRRILSAYPKEVSSWDKSIQSTTLVYGNDTSYL